MIINVIKFIITMIALLTVMSLVSTILSRRKMRKMETIRKDKKRKDEKVKEETLRNKSVTMPAEDEEYIESDDDETDSISMYDNEYGISGVADDLDEDDYALSDDEDISAYMNNYTVVLTGRTETMNTGRSVIAENTTGSNADMDVEGKKNGNGLREHEKNVYRNNSYENSPVQRNMYRNPNPAMLNDENSRLPISQPMPYISSMQGYDRSQLRRDIPRTYTAQAEYAQGNTQTQSVRIQENTYTAAIQPAPAWNNGNADNEAYTPHIPDKYKAAADSNGKKLYF